MNQWILTAMAKIAEERGEEMQLPRSSRGPTPSTTTCAARGARPRTRSVHGVRPPPATTAFRGRAYYDFLYGEVWTRDEYLTRARPPAGRASAAARSSGVDAETDRAPRGRPCATGELTYEELQEVVMHVAVYLGWPVARRLDDLLVAAATRAGVIPG